jgi:hypothetical protein
MDLLVGGLATLAEKGGTAPFLLAYLDAGTGSMIFQWAVAGLLGAAFALKMSWRSISARFSRKQQVPDDSE